MKTVSKMHAMIIAVVTLMFASCFPTTKSPDRIAVGVHSWPGGGLVYIGAEKGFFKEENLDVQILKIENFDTKRAALISGQIDIDIANTLDQLLIYNETDFQAEAIGVTDESVGGDGLVAKAEIVDLQGLKGKTIAYAEASPSDFFLRYLLSKNGVQLSEVSLKPVADPQVAGNAVIAMQVDAAVTYEPFLSQAAKTQGLKLLASTKEYPTLIPGLLIAGTTRINKNPDVYTRFLRAWYKSADFYYQHRPESEKIIAEGMGMDMNEVHEILSVVEIQTKEKNAKLVNPSTNDNLLDLVTSISAFWKENGFVKKDHSPAGLVHEEFFQIQSHAAENH